MEPWPPSPLPSNENINLGWITGLHVKTKSMTHLEKGKAENLCELEMAKISHGRTHKPHTQEPSQPSSRIQGSCSPEDAFRWQKGEQQIWREYPPHAHLNKLRICASLQLRRETSLVFKSEARGQDRTPDGPQAGETTLAILPLGDAHRQHTGHRLRHCWTLPWKDHDTGGLGRSHGGVWSPGHSVPAAHPGEGQARTLPALPHEPRPLLYTLMKATHTPAVPSVPQQRKGEGTVLYSYAGKLLR